MTPATKKKLKYIFRPNFGTSKLQYITLKIPFFHIPLRFKSYILPYLFGVLVLIIAYNVI